MNKPFLKNKRRLSKMNDQILKLPIEKLTVGTINKLSSNSVGICKSHFEQFITTQPGMIDLLNPICQSLTYDDSKSVKNVTNDFQVWISNSELFRLAYEADLVIAKVIATINGSYFKEHFGNVLNDAYKPIIGNCNTNMLELFIEIMKDYLEEDVATMKFSVVLEKDETLISYGNFIMDLCFSFEILALLAGFRFMKMGIKEVEEMPPEEIFKSIIGI